MRRSSVDYILLEYGKSHNHIFDLVVLVAYATSWRVRHSRVSHYMLSIRSFGISPSTHIGDMPQLDAFARRISKSRSSFPKEDLT